MKRLTPRTRDVWEAISAARGPLSYREIGAALGMPSMGSVAWHMQRLEELGVIEKEAGKYRAYAVVQPFSWVDV